MKDIRIKELKNLSVAALLIASATFVACSSDDNIIDTPQHPVNPKNTVTLTTTVSMDGAETRALTSGGVKTFAAGETIAVIYQDTSGATVKAESEALGTDDITDEGKSATFTVTLDDPDNTIDVTYIYPAAMANSDGTPNYDALATQDGSLTTLASNLDYCCKTASWDDSSLPSGVELENQLTICAFTLKDCFGSSIITSSLSEVTVSDGTNTYTVAPATGNTFDDDVIYVAMKPVTTNAALELTATDNTKYYAKAATSRTYPANSLNNISMKMYEVIIGKFTVDNSGKQVYFAKGNLQATTSNLGSTWTWQFAENQWDKIGDAIANININGNGTVSTNGTVDLFGWSTGTTVLGIHNSTNNNDYRNDFVDWGSAAAVTAGIGTGWYTLSGAEWWYLFGLDEREDHRRPTNSGYHYCKAQVNDVPGVILLPDDWDTSYHALTFYDELNLSFNASNIDKITLAEWNSDFAPHGAVFLPTSGQRNGNTVSNPEGRLYYWSSTGGTNNNNVPIAYQVYIAGNQVNPNTGASRYLGNAVRLVRNVK